jgi:hypothetical protein
MESALPRRPLVLRAFVLLTLLFLAMARAEEAGKIQILSVQGMVEVSETPAGAPSPAEANQTLHHKHRLVTGKDSQAILLFSNGSTITVGPDSTFSIEEFLQKPFDLAATDFRTLPAEPTKSHTSVTLKQTSLIGNIRKLKKGSSFDIVTPVGVAGIRGTLLQARSWVQGGRTYSTVAVVEGEVEVTTNAGEKITLKAGFEVTFSAPNEDLKNVTAGPVTPVTAETRAAIEAAGQRAFGSIPNPAFVGAVFEPNPPPPGPQAPIPGANTLGTQSSGGSGSANQQPTPPPAPPPAS